MPAILRGGVAVAIAIAAVMAGTCPTSRSDSAGFTSTPCPNPIIPGVPQYDLGPELQCGYLTVPESRAQPAGRTIRIPVARLPAQSPAPRSDPIVFLAGGPGGSGLLEQSGLSGWNAERDVIFISQRGTLKADPQLSCPEIDEFTSRSTHLVMTDPSTATISAAATRACRDRHTAQGWDVADFYTPENVADVGDLRVALGIDEWNVYGESYGTYLAMQLLRDRPEGVRALVLDSVVPAQTRWVEVDWTAAAAGYKALFDACAVQQLCRKAFPDVHADFTRLVADLTAHPRTMSVPDPTSGRAVDVVIDGYKLANLVVQASINSELRPEIPLIVHDLATGDGTKAAQALLPSPGPAGLFGYGLQLGVQCREYVPLTSREQMRDAGKEALPEFPDAVLSLLPQTPYVFSDCVAWDVPPAPPGLNAPVRSDVPVLLVSGALDAVTPPMFAQIAAHTLPNSRQLVFPGAGHAVAVTSVDCFATVMTDFLDQPADFATGCLAAEQVPMFVTS